MEELDKSRRFKTNTVNTSSQLQLHNPKQISQSTALVKKNPKLGASSRLHEIVTPFVEQSPRQESSHAHNNLTLTRRQLKGEPYFSTDANQLGLQKAKRLKEQTISGALIDNPPPDDYSQTMSRLQCLVNSELYNSLVSLDYR